MWRKIHAKRVLLKKTFLQVFNTLKSYRIDIKNVGTVENNIDVEANDCKKYSPSWLVNKDGCGCVIEGHKNKQSIKIQVIKDGILHFVFRGIDKKYDNKRLPVWINYKSIKIDGKEILSEPVEA